MRGLGWPLCAFVDAVISAPAPNECERARCDEARGCSRGTDDVRGLARSTRCEARLEQGRGAADAAADAAQRLLRARRRSFVVQPNQEMTMTTEEMPRRCSATGRSPSSPRPCAAR